tara:strand:+ start:3014 stop:3790 length:777 start_codon:yes stop_codon:yes gene_type:complete
MEFLSANTLLKQDHPILFLHGAYCDSWVWQENFLEYFTSKGFDCYTVDFEVEQSLFTMCPTTLATYVNQVLDAIKKIGKTPIIVGHSMAGAVMQKLYQQHQIEFPAWILMTPAPARNFHESSQEMLMNNPMLFSQMYMLQMLGKNFVSPTLAKHALFSKEFDDKKAESYIPLVKGMPNTVVADIMMMNIPDRDLQVNFPVLLQAATQDNLISDKNIKTVEKTFGIKAKYYESGHAIMLDNQWQESADDIVEFIEKNVK